MSAGTPGAGPTAAPKRRRTGTGEPADPQTPANTRGLTLAATQTHGVLVGMPVLAADTCAAASAGLLARVAASPMMPGALVLLEVSDRYRLLGQALSNHIGMTPAVPDADRDRDR